MSVQLLQTNSFFIPYNTFLDTSSVQHRICRSRFVLSNFETFIRNRTVRVGVQNPCVTGDRISNRTGVMSGIE